MKKIFLNICLALISMYCGAQTKTYNPSAINQYSDKTGIRVFETVEQITAYEDKTIAVFKVFQVLCDGVALAIEKDYDCKSITVFTGKVVLLIGKDGEFYDDQIVTIHFPLHVGTYKYDTKNGETKTVPIIAPLPSKCQ